MVLLVCCGLRKWVSELSGFMHKLRIKESGLGFSPPPTPQSGTIVLSGCKMVIKVAEWAS